MMGWGAVACICQGHSPGIKSWVFLTYCGASSESSPSFRPHSSHLQIERVAAIFSKHTLSAWSKPELTLLPLLPSTSLIEAHQARSSHH